VVFQRSTKNRFRDFFLREVFDGENMPLGLGCQTSKIVGLYLVSIKRYSKDSHTHGLFKRNTVLWIINACKTLATESLLRWQKTKWVQFAKVNLNSFTENEMIEWLFFLINTYWTSTEYRSSITIVYTGSIIRKPIQSMISTIRCYCLIVFSDELL
jgi:hypothetical protein